MRPIVVSGFSLSGQQVVALSANSMEYGLDVRRIHLTALSNHFVCLQSLIRDLFQKQDGRPLRLPLLLPPPPPPPLPGSPRGPPARLDPAEQIKPRVRVESVSLETTSVTERGTARTEVMSSDAVRNTSLCMCTATVALGFIAFNVVSRPQLQCVRFRGI